MWDDLASIEPRFHYAGERTRYLAFPLGGLGSGGFSISGSGRLIDWSIRNRLAIRISPSRPSGMANWSMRGCSTAPMT